MAKKVIVGLSGGVDSSVSAHILKEQGYDVEGVSLMLFDSQSCRQLDQAPRCSNESAIAAAKNAEQLGIRHNIVDARELFSEKVIKPFIDAYSRGITPNPCILCNRFVKFPSLIEAADRRRFDFIATGHYARVQSSEPGACLLKGTDSGKDQSYVLYALDKDILTRLLLPLGERKKQEVRQIAYTLDLHAATQAESQEICFIEEKNYASFMKGIANSESGPIIDISSGKEIGQHNGIFLFTIGQRKRLPAAGKPTYVVRIDPATNAVYTGSRDKAQMKRFKVKEINWLADPPGAQFKATVKIRSTMKDEPANLNILANGIAEVEFCVPQWAPTPGQSAVFYDGDIVLGGGIITY
ncbi:MAG TPA: tRNA 2-thiouridine(34) synthase MnmA [Dissulfurispiraceae bacterium]|nr:tRNA 2-thiouridine(34) synthase MnmA [Dissulfurispiraceae bacterium]